MKNLLISFIFILSISSVLFSQAPQAFSYQAVIRDASNNLIVSTGVGTRISIVKDSTSGVVVYEERHTPVTNANGLISLEIGRGAVLSGVFNTIDWSTGNYYVKSATDPTGGSTYSIIGTSNLLSVPYALYAANGGTQGAQGPQGAQGAPGQSGCDIISVGDMIVVYTSTHAYGFSQNQQSGSSQPHPDDDLGQWTSTTISGTVLGVESSEKQIVIYTSTHAYGFSQNQQSYSSQPYPDDDLGQWTSTTLSGTPIGSLHSKKQVVVYTSTHAYGFSQNQQSGSSQPHPDDDLGQWTSTTISGTVLGGGASSKNIVLYTSSHAYGFSQNQQSYSTQPHPDDDLGQWTSTTLSGTPAGIVSVK